MTTPFPSGAEKGRLARRVQAVARLRHPNLVRMLPLPGGAGLAPVLGNARRLADFTLPRGTFKRFDLEQVVRLLLDVLSGLSALHEVVTEGQAFVHGDVSPSNIYVDEHGTARLVPLLNVHSTTGALSEANDYAAPERRAGQPLSVQADVFSVGVMLWEALAGKRWGKAPPKLELPARLRWAEPLCPIAERATASYPKLRFASAIELRRAIATAVASQLSKLDPDAWQEEAPTPVFQPGLHLASLRAVTPPPAVLNLLETAPPASLTTPPDSPAAKRGRGWVMLPAIAAASVALGAAVLVKAPSGAAQHVAAAAPPARLVAEPLPSSVAAVVSPAAPPVAEPAPSLRQPVAAPSISAPLSSAAPVSPPPVRPSKSPAAATPAPAVTKAKPKPRTGDSDYGI